MVSTFSLNLIDSIDSQILAGHCQHWWLWVSAHESFLPTALPNNSGRQALEALILNPVEGLYTNNASAPLQAAAGVRKNYDFGLYSYCAYVDANAGTCSDTAEGQRFMPYDIITSDMSSNYSILSSPFIPNNSFRDSKYLGDSSKAAYWLILLGTISGAVSLFL